VLPKGIRCVAVEAGVTDGWYKYVGSDGEIVGMNTFGESAPANKLFEHFGFTINNVVNAVKKDFVTTGSNIFINYKYKWCLLKEAVA